MTQQKNCDLIESIPWRFQRGVHNAIIDVGNIRAGHLTLSKDIMDKSDKKVKIRTGLTAVLPGDMRSEERYFIGFFQTGGSGEISGYQVIEDFRYLNSPLVLSNIHNLGSAYNGVLSYGFELGRSEIWPPMVLSIDDSHLDGSTAAIATEADILQLFSKASNLSVEEGSVGIGVGLQAFGWKGGIGSSSRMFTVDERRFSVGALVASNFGNGHGFNRKKDKLNPERRFLKSAGSLSIILSADVPLLPYQIKRIATGVVLGLPLERFIDKEQDSILCLLFSVAHAMTMKEEGPKVFEYTLSSDAVLNLTEEAASESVKEAILRSVCLSAPIDGKNGRTSHPMPGTHFRSLLKVFEETV